MHSSLGGHLVGMSHFIAAWTYCACAVETLFVFVPVLGFRIIFARSYFFNLHNRYHVTHGHALKLQ